MSRQKVILFSRVFDAHLLIQGITRSSPSYENNINLEIPAEDFTYRGGLTIEGSQLIAGWPNYWDDYSTIEANDTKGRSFRAISTRFVFLDSLIRSKQSQISIYHDSDSIYHPIVRV